VRQAIHAGRKLHLSYRTEDGTLSERKVWPIAIGYMDYARMLVAWCELRGDFRHFRADRVTAAAFLDERYPERPGILRARWRKGLEDKPFSPPAAPSAA
jgi:predicted DNA-binding transcriptional regulator YafY